MRYRVGDFVLDLSKFELRKHGIVLAVEPQVLSVLFLLIENRHRLITKEELVSTIWEGRAVSDGALSGRIKDARHLLGDDGEKQQTIRTVHGKGFRFVGEVTACESSSATCAADTDGAAPSIAVLPFECDDPGLVLISDGVPHELIVGLSKLRSLTVIGRGSSFRFRGWPGDLSEVGIMLGVSYCLTGTARRVGSLIVVTVELVEARSGRVVWGELYEGAINRLHEVRKSILAQILSTLELRVSRHEVERIKQCAHEELNAWSCYHVGLQHLFRFNKQDNLHALAFFERAASRDPSFARAHAGISSARFQNAFMRYTEDVDQEVRLARGAAETAIQLDEQDPTANLVVGRSLWLEGAIESSVPWLDRGIALSPNYAQAIYSRAWTQMILCESEAGQQNARAAIRLSPFDPLRYAMMAIDGFTQTALGDSAPGALLADRAAREPRAHVLIAVMAAICQKWADNEAGTQYWAKEIKSRRPDLTKKAFLGSFPFKQSPLRVQVEKALVEIGL